MKTLLMLLFASLLSVGAAMAEDNEQQIDLKDVPKAVKKAVKTWIKANAKGGKIEEVEIDSEDGRKTYEFEVEGKDGTEYELEVSETGEILEVERNDDDGDDDDDDDDDKRKD